MKRITFILLYLLLPIFLFHSNLSAQESELVPTVKYLSGSLYFLQCQGGNMVFSVGEEGALLVDTEFDHNYTTILGAIKSVKDVEIKCIINTHYHPDHVGGNQKFCEEATIISTNNTRDLLSQDITSYEGRERKHLDNKALPRITFEKKMNLFFNREAIHLVQMPAGHTKGDLVVWFDSSKVVQLGDIFFNKRLPYIDIAGGASLSGLMNNIKLLIEEIPYDYTIIPGHGPIATKDDLIYYNERLKDAVAYIKKQVDSGQTMEQIIMMGLPEAFESYPPIAVTEDKWIEIIYRLLISENTLQQVNNN